LHDASVTLSQRAIGSEFPLPRVSCNVQRLRSSLRQLVDAISALHAAGKLHRDIKPSNVLVTPAGRVVVLDFGLVSSLPHFDPDARDAERTIGGCVFGTPAYMSPEQAAGEPVTTASDWYSVGAMLYEALTGQLPFDGTVLQILKAKEESQPVPPSDLLDGVPDDLDQLCRSLLRRDPQKRPHGTEIQRCLAGGSHPAASYNAQANNPPVSYGEIFIGRERHLSVLRRAFEQASNGQPATVLVHGNSGIGKTALVRCFANELIKNEEAVVLRGRCYERESVPYKAFDDIVDALGRYMMRLPMDEATQLLPRNVHALARLFPVLKRVKAVAGAHLPIHQTDDQRELRNQAFGALRDLLLRLSDWHPLVVTIDDLQWGDMDSARLLSHILQTPDAPPILFIGTYRRDEAFTSPFLRHILGDDAERAGGPRVDQLAVDALTEEEAEALTHELLRGFPLANALFARAVAAESDGVPFFIGELAEHVKTQVHTLPSALESVSLDTVLAARVGAMSVEAQRVLQVLSVAARPIEQGVALEAAGLPPSDRRAMLALRAARLIRTRGTRQTDYAETYHDRVREAVTDALSKERSREIHAAIARASETWGVGEPEQLVVHYAEAGEGVRAGGTALQAAQTASAQLAFDRASELYRKAIDLLPPGDAQQRCELHRQLGEALANAGRGAQAAQAFLIAAETLQGADARALKRKAAQQLLRSGRTEQGVALAKSLFAEVGLSYPASKTATLTSYFWNRSQLNLRQLERGPRTTSPSSTDDVQRERMETLAALFQELGVQDNLTGALFQTRFLRHAIAVGDPQRILQGLVWEAFHQSMPGNRRSTRNAELALRHAAELAQHASDPAYARGLLSMVEASRLIFDRSRFRDALAPAREAEAIFRDQCRGAYWERSWTALLRFTALEVTGDLRELSHEALRLTRDAIDRDDHSSLRLLLLAAPFAHLVADDPRSASAFVDAYKAGLSDGFTTSHYLAMARSIDAHLYVGNAEAALAEISRGWPIFRRSFLSQCRALVASANWYYARCAAALYAQTGAPALRTLATARARAAIAHECGYAGYGKLVLAGLAEIDGEIPAACDYLTQAIEHFEVNQADHGILYAMHRRAALAPPRGQRAELDRVTSELVRQGVRAPESWVALWIPSKPASH
jgi:hypothetical protein